MYCNWHNLIRPANLRSTKQPTRMVGPLCEPLERGFDRQSAMRFVVSYFRPFEAITAVKIEGTLHESLRFRM